MKEAEFLWVCSALSLAHGSSRFLLCCRAFVETISCNTDNQLEHQVKSSFLKQRVWQLGGGGDRRIRTWHQPQLYGRVEASMSCMRPCLRTQTKPIRAVSNYCQLGKQCRPHSFTLCVIVWVLYYNGAQGNPPYKKRVCSLIVTHEGAVPSFIFEFLNLFWLSSVWGKYMR